MDDDFRLQGGGDASRYLDSLFASADVAIGDLLYAGQRQRARILQRTARGVDYQGRAFAPYSTRGPIYYRPSPHLSPTGQRGAVSRIFRRFSGGQPGSGIMARSRTGLSIRFDNGYAGLKSWAGRANVDLMGLRAPHMLQQMVVSVGGTKLLGDGNNQFNSTPAKPVEYLRIGIYGEAAVRAGAHNNGVPSRNIPRRRFLDASASDVRAVIADINFRRAQRARR